MRIRIRPALGLWWFCIVGLSMGTAYAVLVPSRHASSPGSVRANVTAGRQVFIRSCAVCHGFEGEGFPGLGKPLRSNGFVGQQSKGQLADFVAVGRPADDPLNSTGVEMPARGGDIDLSDQDLLDVAAYLLTLNPGGVE